MTPPLTPPQLHILQHALGLDQYGQGERYRNHFVAGGDDVAACEGLVDLGLMAKVAVVRELTGAMPCFQVTPEGQTVVWQQSPVPPKLSRSKQRYRAFLDADTGERFGDWIRRNRDKGMSDSARVTIDAFLAPQAGDE